MIKAQRWICIAFGICTLPGFAFPHKKEMPVLLQWSRLEFDYSSSRARQNDIQTGNFIPGKPTPIDVDVYHSYDYDSDSKIFITIPKFQTGVPLSLGIVTTRKLHGNPVIAPYPSWEWHRTPEQCQPNRIVSVFRVAIDECERLWVLDTGRLQDNIVCPPQILAFDLHTDQLVNRYEIPRSQYEQRSIFVTPVVDVRDAHDQCSDTFIYAADCTTFSIVVYDVRNGVSWRITDKTMFPYPNFGTYHIADDKFDLMDGVLGMALEPYDPGQDRRLFYQAMSSGTMNYVSTSLIRNRTRFINNAESSPEIFKVYRGYRNTQSAAIDIDKHGIMYFGLMSDITINCWNIATEYGLENIEPVADNPYTLQFASGVKVRTNRKTLDELWVLTSRFQKIGANTLDPDEINFRILVERTDNLVAGTTCTNDDHHKHKPANNHGGYGLHNPPPHYKQ